MNHDANHSGEDYENCVLLFCENNLFTRQIYYVWNWFHENQFNSSGTKISLYSGGQKG